MRLKGFVTALSLLLAAGVMAGCTSQDNNNAADFDQAALVGAARSDTSTGDPEAPARSIAAPSSTPGPQPSTTALPTHTPTVTLQPSHTPRPPTTTPRPQPTEPRIEVGAERAAANRAAVEATATTVAEVAARLSDVNTLPTRVILQMPHEYQRRNNCAPTTTSMVLRYYGLNVRQADLAVLQKPVAEDVNVTAEEVALSIEELGLRAYVGHNGDIDLVLKLLAAGFPIITEEWIAHDGGVGHFRAIRGYDREQQRILYNDSFHGADLWRGYEQFYRDWAPFNNKFVVAYRPEQEALLRALIGDQWDTGADYAMLLEVSTAQVNANPNDGYALWGMGEALVRLGQPEEALIAFENALATNTLPMRYLWYRYGYFEALNAVGEYEEVLAQTRPTLTAMKRSEDLRFHRAVAYHGLGDLENTVLALELALEDNPRFIPARVMLDELVR